MKKILVFIPMYNCEKQIPRVVAQFDKDTQKLFSEILIVDNRSIDNSLNVAINSIASLTDIKATVIQNNNNVSLGGSHKVAFNYALEHNFDYIIVLHGDDQGSIDNIIPYIKNEQCFNYDAFLGSRFAKGSKTVGYSKFRIFGNYVFNFLISIFFRRPLTDMGSGLNMLSVKSLSTKYYMPFANNLTFNVYLLFYLAYSKTNFTFFPILWREDDQVSNAKMFSQAFHILKMLGRYMTNAKKLFTEDNNEQKDYSYEVKSSVNAK